MSRNRLALARVLAVLTVAFGVVYIGWRWTGTINWHAWWIAIPLVLAETYSLGESVLYALTMWNARRRPTPPPAPEGRTVDVFVTTYNEPLELVMRTAIAARDMTYPHQTWILDDGNRPEFERAADAVGVGYLNRGPEWDGRQRFAKAGNVNNALFKTTGELIAILDADQVPEPRFLDSVLGYFEDPEVAFVQTPQRFWNVPAKDPLGSQAELFYGPIQQGKDGWGAAFFCGSNAVLRRDALMALGLARFSAEATGRTRDALRKGRRRLESVLAAPDIDGTSTRSLLHALAAVDYALSQLRHGEVLTEITYRLRHAFDAAMSERTSAWGDAASEPVRSAMRHVYELVDVARSDEALAIHPLDTTSITEDMATAMHLHAMGWSSVYHHEVLVHGLAPEDLGTMLSQRKRWATGSMQVFFKENPMFVGGLTIAQRLMYLATMTSYLNGFAALAFIAAPIVYLTTGIFPLVAEPEAFFARFVPVFLACQALFLVTGFKAKGLWRGQQMSFALFPTWVEATLAGASAALFGRHLTFSVTSKTKQTAQGNSRLVLPQLLAMAALLVASGVGIYRVVVHEASALITGLSMVWVVVDLALLGAVVAAMRYRGPGDDLVSPVSVESWIEEPVRAESDTVDDYVLRMSALAVVTHAEREVLEVVELTSASPHTRVKSHRIDSERFGAQEALRLRVLIAEQLSEGHDIILLDVSQVSVVTSSGVAALFDLLRFVRSRGGDVRLFGVSSAFSAAHEALQLTSVMRVYAAQPEAAPQTATV
jgi:cellulose synthase (UDP-forming)